MSNRKLSSLVDARKRFGKDELREMQDDIAAILRQCEGAESAKHPLQALQHVAQHVFHGPYEGKTASGRKRFDTFAEAFAMGFNPGHRIGVDAETLLWQLLPYGVYHDFCFDAPCPRELVIFARNYTPLVRIKAKQIIFCDPREWIEHDEARAFASGGVGEDCLAARSDVLDRIVTALRYAMPGSDHRQNYRGDFGVLIRELFKQSYPITALSRRAA